MPDPISAQTENEVSEYYNATTDSYDRRFNNPLMQRIHRLESDFIRQHLPEGVVVLEVGPGTGRITTKLLEQAARVVVVDSAAEMVAKLRQRLQHENLEAHILPISKLPQLPEYGRFGAVVCMHVLPHVEDIEGALRSLAGAIKPGGHLIFDLWNRNSPYVALRQLLRRPNPVLTKYYSYTEMCTLLSTTGLRVVDSTAWGFPLSGRLGLSLEMLGERAAMLIPRFFRRWAYGHLFYAAKEKPCHS